MPQASIPSDIREAIRRLAAGRYRLREQLGQGGMATVYLAVDQRLDRPVAIKVLHRHLVNDDEHCTRFRREAESVAGLDHTGLVEVYDLLEQPGEFLAIVMEYVEGPSLEQLLDDSPPLVPELAAELLIPVLRALHHTHRQGIVHRDLKPANILVGNTARPRLTDFGIAHVVDAQTLTETGDVLGSPAFMSPEGVSDRPIDRRTDLFSIGSMLYLMVTGRPAFSGKAPSTIMRNIARGDRQRADFVREAVGRRFADILERFLHADPDERPQTGAAAARVLEQFVADSLGGDRPDLGAWVDDPAGYPERLRAEVATALYERAERAVDAGSRNRAMPLCERLMAMDPDGDAGALLDRLYDESSDAERVADTTGSSDTPASPRPARRFVVAAAAAGVVLATAAGVWRLNTPTVEETDTAAEEMPEHTTESAAADSSHPARWLRPPLEGLTERVANRAAYAERRKATDAADHTVVAAAQLAGTTTDRGDPAPSPDAVDHNDAEVPTGDNQQSDESAQDTLTRTVRFQLVPASSTLTIGETEFDALEASGGIELEYGSHTLAADGPGVEPYRRQLSVGSDTDTDQSIVLDWHEGYIRLQVDRDALVWVGGDESPRRVDAGEPRVLTIPFGPADQVANRREINVRVADRDDLQLAQEHTVEVRPETETPLSVSLDED